MPNDWQDLVAQAQQRRDESIAKLQPPLPELPAQLPRNVTGIPRSLLSKEEIEITETPIDVLLELLSQGKLTAVAVTNAYLRRAGLAQKLINCVLELLPDEALAQAHDLDAFYAKNKRTVGPLHGLPISLKGQVSLEGKHLAAGVVALLREKAVEDAPLVKILKSHGAIPFVRTTEPQGLMMLECLGPTHGSTTNAHNTALTPGGSSGGEGAIAGILASPLGIGADIGGSVRCPAAHNGIYTLKPTCGRLPLAGLSVFFAGSEMILGTAGPMTPWRKGVSLFMKMILDTKPWETDPSVLPLPWRELKEPFGPTINIGVIWDDGLVTPSKAMTRALKEVVEKLKANPKFTITEWQPFKQEEAIKILEKLYAPDGGDGVRRFCEASGEPIHELIDYRLVSGPGVERLSILDTRDWVKAREAFRYNFLHEWRTKAPEMQFILCPPHAGAAPPIGTSKYWGYTSYWNLLDYPAAIFPVTRVDPTLDAEDPSYEPRSEIDAWTHQHFDAENQAGAPVSLQIVGKRFQDEEVCLVMDEICEAVGLPFFDCLRSEK